MFGLREGSSVEAAIFANAVAIRYADWNDCLPRSGHPSDMVAAFAAMAEATGASGLDLITAMHVAYEVVDALGVVPLRDRKWDQGVYVSIGVAAGLSQLLSLTDSQTSNAIAIALAPSIPLRVTRTGDGAAKAGLTGPPQVFSGIEGLFEQVTGAFDLGRIRPDAGGRSAHQRVQHKFYPAEMNTQTAIQVMLSLRGQFALADVETIDIATYRTAWHETGGGQGDAPEKWNPQNRETADHSMPYYMAVALVDGAVSLDSFVDARIRDPLLRPILKKIRVVENPDFTAGQRERGEQPAEITVRLNDGQVLREQQLRPRGHIDNPMSDDEISAKFRIGLDHLLPRQEAEELLDRLWHLDTEASVNRIGSLFRRFGSQ